MVVRGVNQPEGTLWFEGSKNFILRNEIREFVVSNERELRR